MGHGFQVWKFHLKISPWEASFSSRGLIFGGEEISIPETRPIRKFYIVLKIAITTTQFKIAAEKSIAMH
jgi:hypothetical protein